MSFSISSIRYQVSLKYKKESINNNIYYISGKLVVAKGDIDTEDNEIFIELPEGCKWIDVSEDSSSELIKAKFKTDKTSPRKAILTFNKFRNKNHIIINGIIEGHKLSTDIYEKIRFSHEIIKTDDVKVEDKNLFQEKILFLCTAVAIIADIIVLLRSNYGCNRSNSNTTINSVSDILVRFNKKEGDITLPSPFTS